MNHLGEIAAIMAAASWSLNSLVTEKFGQNLTARAMNLIRIFFGFLATSIVLLFTGAPVFGYGLDPKSLALLSSGIFGFAFGDTFLFSAIKELGSRVTVLIFAFSPVLTGILSYFIFNETMSLLSIAGIAIILAGIFLVIFRGNGKSLKLDYSPKGVLFASLATLWQSIGNILSKYALTDISPFKGTQVRLLGGLIGMVVYFMITGAWKEITPLFHERNSKIVAFSGSIIGTLIGVGLSMIALKYTKAAVASVLMSTMPVIVLILSFFFFKEKVSLKEAAGALLSVFGIALLFM